MRRDEPNLHGARARAGSSLARGASWLMLGIALVLAAPARGAQVPTPPAGSATLSLEEVLKLYRERARAPDPEADRPPIDAVVQRLDLEGRILEDALTVRAAVRVEVLSDERWVSVPLLAVDDKTLLDDVPSIDGAALAVVDGALHLVSRRKGRFEFEVGLSSQASGEGPLRSASIGFPGATLARCRLGYDPALFELDGKSGDVQGDVVNVKPRGNRFEVKWRHRAAQLRPGTPAQAAPEAEPVIPTAHASVVSTLEGEHILRVAYRLRFTGRKPIAFELPDGHTLIRAYLNGRPVTVDGERRELAFDVFAARAGQAGGEVELVLAASDRGYLLSGRLPLELPRPSWRTNELYLSAHLPAVFDYAWTSGTLSPVDRSPEVSYVYEIPTPGKRLHFRQFLVHRSTPALTLEYAVSLDGHYFRP